MLVIAFSPWGLTPPCCILVWSEAVTCCENKGPVTEWGHAVNEIPDWTGRQFSTTDRYDQVFLELQEMGLPTCALGIKCGQRSPHVTDGRYSKARRRVYRQHMHHQGCEGGVRIVRETVSRPLLSKFGPTIPQLLYEVVMSSWLGRRFMLGAMSGCMRGGKRWQVVYVLMLIILGYQKTIWPKEDQNTYVCKE